MKYYKVKVRFTYTGIFEIKADNAVQAREYAEQHCGATISGGVQSSLGDEDVDWEFPVHPDKKVLSIKRS